MVNTAAVDLGLYTWASSEFTQHVRKLGTPESPPKACESDVESHRKKAEKAAREAPISKEMLLKILNRAADNSKVVVDKIRVEVRKVQAARNLSDEQTMRCLSTGGADSSVQDVLTDAFVRMLNLGAAWLESLLPHVLRKINRGHGVAHARDAGPGLGAQPGARVKRRVLCLSCINKQFTCTPPRPAAPPCTRPAPGA